MALSAFTFDTCVPPTSFVSLAYDSERPNSINTSTIFNTFATNGLNINQNPLTIPTQCNSGMDIVFLVDYTGSMGAAINGVKAGISNILSTINTESLGNYRVSLCIFDEYSGNITSPNNYGSTSTYLNLPATQKAVINTFNTRTQFITCVQPLDNIGSTTDFQTKLNLLATPSFPLGDGQFSPEPGELGVNEILSNNIAGSFRSDAIKLIILITDALPGGNDDVNNTIDETYINGTLIDLCDSYDVQVMTQSSLYSLTPGNYYYNLSTGTNIPGRYDQVTFDGAGNWINTGLVSGIQNLCNDSYIATCASAPSGWYYEAGSAYAVYYDSELGYATNTYYFPPTYTVYPNTSYIDEQGSTVIWDVYTNYVNNGTVLYWDLNSGTANSNDIINAINGGSFTVNNGSGLFQLTTKSDHITEGTETLIIRIRTGSVSGPIVATSSTVYITDSSLTPTATPIPPTATHVPCYTYNFQLVDSWNSGYIQYTMCDGRSDTVYLAPYSQPVILCVKAIGYYQNIIITNVGSECYTSSGAGAGYPTATPIPPTPTAYSSGSGSGTGSGIPTATPVPQPTATPLPFSSYIAERNDGAAWGYVGPYSASYTSDDSVRINDGSGLCWTLGSPTTANYTYAIIGACLPPTATPAPTDVPEPTVETGCAEFDLFGGTTGRSFFITRCDDTTTTRLVIPAGDSVTECIKLPYFAAGAVRNGICYSNNAIDPDPTVMPTKVISPTPTPTISGGGGGGGGGCLLEGTLVKLSNGTEATIESLTIGMELSSIIIGNMPDGDNFEILKQWSQTNPTLSNTLSIVTQNTEHIVNSVLSFNDGLLISSEDHVHVIKRNSIWFIMKANDILVGDSFINQNGSEQIINSIVKNSGSFKVYKLDVESNDVYIANGIITHNLKEEITPV